jgi:hypothetical protein
MRDAGKYPLEPPGVQLDQPVQLMAASVERVMGAHSSALMKQLSRKLAVVNLCQKEGAPFVMLCRWIDHMAPLLNAEASSEHAPAPLWTCVVPLRPRSPQGHLWALVTYVEKITVAVTLPRCAS